MFSNEIYFVNSQFMFLAVVIVLMSILLQLTNLLLNPILNLFSTIKFTSFLSIFMGIKFILLLGLLIVVRGGIPRYRYDFLTKLGWIKTLSLVLVIFLINLLLTYL